MLSQPPQPRLQSQEGGSQGDPDKRADDSFSHSEDGQRDDGLSDGEDEICVVDDKPDPLPVPMMIAPVPMSPPTPSSPHIHHHHHHHQGKYNTTYTYTHTHIYIYMCVLEFCTA